MTITAIYTSPYIARIPAPDPLPWGWMAAPASTVERLLKSAGFAEAERIYHAHADASFRIRRPEGCLFVDWNYSGSFTLASNAEPLPAELVDTFVTFVNDPLGKGR